MPCPEASCLGQTGTSVATDLHDHALLGGFVPGTSPVVSTLNAATATATPCPEASCLGPIASALTIHFDSPRLALGLSARDVDRVRVCHGF
jgi:hypothetical protein